MNLREQSTPLRKGQRGFSHHLLMPILAVVAVAVIGGITLRLIHAATLTVALYQGSCAQKVELTQANAASANSDCVKQVQNLIDIYQYSGAKVAIGGSGETFAYEGTPMLNLTGSRFGSYDGATQGAVNAITHASPSLTNASVTSSNTIDKGTWETFCGVVHGRITTTAFTGHPKGYNFGGGNTIASPGTTIFTAVCGSQRNKSFSTGSSGSSSQGNGSSGTSGSSKGNTAAASGCASKSFQAGSKDSGSSHCVQYIQQMINGRDAYIITKLDSASYINGVAISALTNSAQFYSVNSQFGVTSGSYSSGMKSGVANMQAWDNSPNTNNIKLYFNMTLAQFNSTFKPNGNLPTNGAMEGKTWYDLCQWISKMPVSARTITSSTDYTGGKPNGAGTNRTNMWYLRSYMRTAVTAASVAGCKA